MMRRRRIYIAGALTPTGSRADCKNPAIEYLANVRDMLDAFVYLVKKGWSPYCPALDIVAFLHLPSHATFGEAEIKGVSMAWLSACEAVLLLDGWENSTGTRAELKEAERMHIPIYGNINFVPIADLVEDTTGEINEDDI